MKNRNLKIGFFSLLTILFFLFSSESLFAARVLDGNYLAKEKILNLTIAYMGGCQAPDYFIQWEECAFDESSRRTFLYGWLLTKEEVVSCDINVEQKLQFPLSEIKCDPDLIFIKSTSSKSPFLIRK